jgi:hypothetical protein
MNGHARRLVDDDHIVVFVNHSNGLRSDGRLMPMKRVADNIAIFYLRIGRRDGFPVDVYCSTFYCCFLGSPGQRRPSN